MLASEVLSTLRRTGLPKPPTLSTAHMPHILWGGLRRVQTKDGANFEAVDRYGVSRAYYDTAATKAAMKALAEWHSAVSPGGTIDLETPVFGIYPGVAQTIPEGWWRWMEQSAVTWDQWRELMAVVVDVPFLSPSSAAIQAQARKLFLSNGSSVVRKVDPLGPWAEPARAAFADLSVASQAVYTSSLRRLARRLTKVGVATTDASAVWAWLEQNTVTPGELNAWKRLVGKVVTPTVLGTTTVDPTPADEPVWTDALPGLLGAPEDNRRQSETISDKPPGE